jgi:hypothetical protein
MLLSKYLYGIQKNSYFTFSFYFPLPLRGFIVKKYLYLLPVLFVIIGALNAFTFVPFDYLPILELKFWQGLSLAYVPLVLHIIVIKTKSRVIPIITLIAHLLCLACASYVLTLTAYIGYLTTTLDLNANADQLLNLIVGFTLLGMVSFLTMLLYLGFFHALVRERF